MREERGGREGEGYTTEDLNPVGDHKDRISDAVFSPNRWCVILSRN